MLKSWIFIFFWYFLLHFHFIILIKPLAIKDHGSCAFGDFGSWVWCKLSPACNKQNRSTEGCSKLKRSVDMTSSGKNGLNIRTNASPKWDKMQVPNGIKFSNKIEKMPYFSNLLLTRHLVLSLIKTFCSEQCLTTYIINIGLPSQFYPSGLLEPLNSINHYILLNNSCLCR